MEKGASLYLAVLIMVILTSIVLSLSVILVNQIKMISGMENSVISFSAADTGIEMVLEEDADATSTNNILGDVDYIGQLDNGAEFQVTVYSPGEGNCPADVDNFCINSSGVYKGNKRAIQVTR